MNKKKHQAYLQSKHWKEVKRKYARTHEYKCYVCGKRRKLHLHHRTYKRLGNERMSDLVYLCEKHHEELHRLVGRRKLRWKGAEKELRKRWQSREKKPFKKPKRGKGKFAERYRRKGHKEACGIFRIFT